MEKLVDAIKEGEIIRMPESVARAEDLFILRNASDIESKEKEMALLQKSSQKNDFKKTSFFDSWKRGDLYKKNNVVNELIQNFHWEITKKRRSKNLSRAQLAAKLNISEEDLKMIEMGNLPSDDFIYINKIEEYLGINLRKDKASSVSLADLQKKNAESKTSEKKKSDEIEILND